MPAEKKALVSELKKELLSSDIENQVYVIFDEIESAREFIKSVSIMNNIIEFVLKLKNERDDFFLHELFSIFAAFAANIRCSSA